MDKLTENPVFRNLRGNLKSKMHSKMCNQWRATHENCKGCPSYKECKEWMYRIFSYTTKVLIEDGTLPFDYEPNLDER